MARFNKLKIKKLYLTSQDKTKGQLSREILVTASAEDLNALVGAATSGTNGLSLAGAYTQHILLGGSSTYGIKTTGNITNPLYIGHVGSTSDHVIDMIDAYTGLVIETGSYSSSASKGVTLVAANNRPVAFLFDDAGAALGAADYRPVLSRVLYSVDQTNAHTMSSLRGQLKLNNLVDIGHDNSVCSSITGYVELAGTGARSIKGHFAAIRGTIEEGASGATTVAASAVMCGLELTLNSTRTYTETGTHAAMVINISGGTSVWSNGIFIADASTTVGIDIGSCTTGIDITGATTTCINMATPTGSIFKMVADDTIVSDANQAVLVDISATTNAGFIKVILDTATVKYIALYDAKAA